METHPDKTEQTINLPSGFGLAHIDTSRFDPSKSKSIQFVYITITYRRAKVKVTGVFERLDDFRVSWHRFYAIKTRGLRVGSPKSKLVNELCRELRRFVSTKLLELGYTYDYIADVWEAPLAVWGSALTAVL